MEQLISRVQIERKVDDVVRAVFRSDTATARESTVGHIESGLDLSRLTRPS